MTEYVVFDLEWNQSPLGREGRVEHLPFEIIEIGAVKLNEQLQIVSEFHRLIKPQVYTQMHYMISEVTHMDMEQLQEDGEAFPDVAREFLAWCGEAIFCTWGPMDLTELQRNMRHFQIEIPWPVPLLYYDVQKLYSLNYEDGKQKSSLELAVEALHLVADRPFHRALDDARYTGMVMGIMGIERVKEYYSMDYYRLPQNREEEVYLKFPSYTKFVSHTFPEREEVMKDRVVTEIHCNLCKRTLRKKVRWFTTNQRIYYALGICPEHGLVKSKIRLKKSEDGEAYAIRTTKMTDSEGAAQIQVKKDEVRKRRGVKKKGVRVLKQ